MTILLRVPPLLLAWRGFDDPRFPVAVWFASGSLVGDASGGTQRISVLFADEGDPVSGDYYNLEQFSVLVSEPTPRDCFIATVNLTPGPVSVFDRQWHFKTEELPALGNTGVGAVRPQLPLFLGARLRDAEAPGTLDIGTSNLTASTSLSVSVMGYKWTSRSIMVPGGLLRPATAPWG